MRIISRHTAETTKHPDHIGWPRDVELTPSEVACRERFDALLDDGAGVEDAALTALSSMLPSGRTPEFVAYLSDRTLKLTQHKRIVRVRSLRPRRRSPILTADQIDGAARRQS